MGAPMIPSPMKPTFAIRVLPYLSSVSLMRF